MTWVRSWDDSFQPVPISRLREMYAAGYRVWCRYVGPGSSGKHWTKAQIDAWFACGPDTGVGMLAEGVGDEPLYNPGVGDDHGRAARAAIKALGLDPDKVLCSPAVDRNVSKAQTLGAVADYMRGWITGYGSEPVPYIEVENGGRLVDAHLSAGTFVPAAYSWNESGKLVTPANAPAHVVQTQERNGVKLAGGVLDIGHIRTDAPHVYWNPASRSGSAPTTGEDMQDQDVIDIWNKPLLNAMPWDTAHKGVKVSASYLLSTAGNQAHAAYLAAQSQMDPAGLAAALAPLLNAADPVTVDELKTAILGAFKQLAAADAATPDAG